MTKALTRRLDALEHDVHELWHRTSTALDEQQKITEQLSALNQKVEKLVKIVHIGMTMAGAMLLQVSGDPAAQHLAEALKKTLSFLLR